MNRAWWLLAALAAPVGLGLIAHGAFQSSASYDELTYMKVGSVWWRTGDQKEIGWMGSPATFWKLQQVPTLWILDRTGRGAWIDDYEAHQAELLPWLRIGASWIWLVAWGLTTAWAGRRHGPRAAALAAWLFALGPNLLAHGGLITMEMPITACVIGILWLYERRLATGALRPLVIGSLACGLAFSCKFTAILLPPLLAGSGLLIRLWRGEPWRQSIRLLIVEGLILTSGMLIMDVLVSGGALLPISPRKGDHPFVDGRGSLGRFLGQLLEIPIPQDWAGFLLQTRMQSGGGAGYLFGEVRHMGWRHYYLVTLAVKVPLAAWALFAARAWFRDRSSGPIESFPILFAALFVLAASAGSSRNYGIRYLLPIAPAVIVWVSALATRGKWAGAIALAGVLAQGAAILAIHPHELTYFNPIAGGPEGGRRILADSNLDWGQGARSLARLQEQHPEYRDLTFFVFSEADPSRYGVAGRIYIITANAPPPDLPKTLSADTPYIAVSASLQWGPWSPPGYFDALKGIAPVAMTDDRTIAIYRTPDKPASP